ncbi:hypothetical protein RUMGNA_01996 [Mediterraneibacter gnavus ATCC 29149]|uniref:Uncharacterized protein n=1 Tax=Mediterraneibacter gnavus (strain ATCC 29149 / DSM 114966 / JCM 6515 / VPI C7-9) TaxID=411470 RepID=A7B368_MEDG7|nr:hypothetical protein RUMGNA_01996 [Mediterraneibacter gnavus ATCC 29149]
MKGGKLLTPIRTARYCACTSIWLFLLSSRREEACKRKYYGKRK